MHSLSHTGSGSVADGVFLRALVDDTRQVVVAVLRAHGFEGEARALARATLDPSDNYGCLYRTLLVVEPSIRVRGPGASLTAVAVLRLCAARVAGQLAAGDNMPDPLIMALKEKLHGKA